VDVCAWRCARCRLRRASRQSRHPSLNRRRRPTTIIWRGRSCRFRSAGTRRTDPRNSATPLKRNIIAWRRPFRHWALKSPMPICLWRQPKVRSNLRILRRAGRRNALKNRAEVALGEEQAPRLQARLQARFARASGRHRPACPSPAIAPAEMPCALSVCRGGRAVPAFAVATNHRAMSCRFFPSVRGSCVAAIHARAMYGRSSRLTTV